MLVGISVLVPVGIAVGDDVVMASDGLSARLCVELEAVGLSVIAGEDATDGLCVLGFVDGLVGGVSVGLPELGLSVLGTVGAIVVGSVLTA